jgi:hypothetical protein
MPAYNFKQQWAEAVRNGFKAANGEPLPAGAHVKRQTIRKPRKRPTRPGDTIYGFTGMRTKQCERLGQAPCQQVCPIIIDEEEVVLDGAPLVGWEQRLLADSDGFDFFVDFITFFKEQYGLPFEGELIMW